MAKKTVLVVGITADRMPTNESLCRQLKWTSGAKFDVRHLGSQEFFLGLKQLLQTYTPALWEEISDADGRLVCGAVSEAQERALANQHFDELGSPKAVIVEDIVRIAHVYQPDLLTDVAARRGVEFYTFCRNGTLKPVR